jgi:dihydroorotate dehydrogenase (fumarate)
MILAGGDAVQVVSTLYKNGPNYMNTILSGLNTWMDEKQYASLDDFRGTLSYEEQNKKDSLAYKRAQYVKMLMQPSENLMNKIT